MNRYKYNDNYKKPFLFFNGEIWRDKKFPTNLVQIKRNSHGRSKTVAYWHELLPMSSLTMIRRIDDFLSEYEPI